MEEIDINNLININCELKSDLPDDIIIIGNIDVLYIKYRYDELNLSRLECSNIYYFDQEGESIKNHILPNSLKELYCGYNQLTSLPDLPNSLIKLLCMYNKLTSIPDLPNSLIELTCYNNKLASIPDLPNLLIKLHCGYNKLTSLPDLPNSLKYLYTYHNKLTSLPDLPNSLYDLYCHNNKLTSIPYLPNSLEKLLCDYNQLTSLPDFTHINHEFELSLYQNLPINYIPYNKNLKLYNQINNKININGYPHNPITNQEELNKYMKYVKNYERNRIKSARK